jgi:superfamily II DNA or RNA helicase
VTKINKINIYSYDIIRSNVGESIIQELVDSKWGVIIYDNAHKAVTPKTVDLLYLKSNYKFAFDSTLNRSDGREQSLLNLFGGITYNISSDELINNLYQKKLECYQADLRKLKITKEEFTRCLLYKMDTKSVVIVTHQINEMERISKVLGIESINRFTKDEKRIELIKNFNDGKIKQLCIGNLVEKYPITNIDVMIAT